MDTYDRQGRPIDVATFSRLHSDPDYKILKHTLLEGVGLWVSTVWLGLDHNWGDGPPRIFESMVFKIGTHLEVDMRRYATEEEAYRGHEELVEEYQADD